MVHCVVWLTQLTAKFDAWSVRHTKLKLKLTYIIHVAHIGQGRINHSRGPIPM